MLVVAPVLAVACGVVGLELSFHQGVAAGPAICLVALGVFAVAAGAASLRARLSVWGSRTSRTNPG